MAEQGWNVCAIKNQSMLVKEYKSENTKTLYSFEIKNKI